MASVFSFCIFFSSILFFISSSSSAQDSSFRPKSLVLPVYKDESTPRTQYLVQINQRTPLKAINLTLDLGGQMMWLDSSSFNSSTYRRAPCHSAQCSLAQATSFAYCLNCSSTKRRIANCTNTCMVTTDNTVVGVTSGGELGSDVVTVRSTDGKSLGQLVSVPRFLFVFALPFFLEGLPSGVVGMAGLGRTKISLHSQFSAAFSFPRKFSLCLAGGGNGNVFFGEGPLSFLPNADVSSFTYTPLIVNPVFTGSGFFAMPSSEYFIGVKSIMVNQKPVPVNATLLSISKEGFGGTKISTVNPYTVLETSIYTAVANAFVREFKTAKRVAPVEPFRTCFSSKGAGSTRLGAAVPQINLVLQSPSVVWRMYGANSMVYPKEDVLCLGFVDGGVNARTSIVIGGYQIEDNLLEFDIARSRLGFSGLLLGRQTTCSNFNYTSSD